MIFGSKTHGWVRFAKSASFGHVSKPVRGRGSTETYRTAKGTKLPIKDTNHTVLRRVEDQVIQLVVSVNDSRAGLCLVWKVLGVPLHEVVESGNLSDWFLAFNIHHCRLRE